MKKELESLNMQRRLAAERLDKVIGKKKDTVPHERKKDTKTAKAETGQPVHVLAHA